jgi:dTDP-4-amino-4,6-dideoxygalactose transaminase
MMQVREQIPLARPVLDDTDCAALIAVMRSGWIASGAQTRRFEEEFAGYIGRPYGLACHSGAAALELALAAQGVGPGDEVIVPSLTFTATAAAACRLGATVVFADITGSDNLTLSAESVAAAFTPQTKAVIFVPHGGYGGSVASVAEVCRNASVPLIEDACHAPGAVSNGQRVGTFGALATYSFHTTKNITTAEGGMVLFDDVHFLTHLQELRSHGVRRIPEMTPDGSDYVVERLGHNHRMSDLAAALGLAQFERIDKFNRERVALSRRYDELLADIDGLVRPHAGERSDGVGHLYTILLPEDRDRRAVRLSLREQGIGTSVHYVPLHQQPAYATVSRWVPLPQTEIVTPRLVTLPLYIGMTESEQDTVATALRTALAMTETASPARIGSTTSTA